MSSSYAKIWASIVAAAAVLTVAPAELTIARQAAAAEAPATSSSPTITEAVIYSFCSLHDLSTGACLDGQGPNGLIQGTDGNFYGTTGSGFASGGTMFKLTPSGALTTLHTFCPNMDPNRLGCPDGAAPGGVIEGSDGNFYGTAANGGVNADHDGGSAGTAYMVTPSGVLTTLHAFCAQVDPSSQNCLDGESPDSIIEGSDGNFYGTTDQGGPYAFGGARPAGTVFKMAPSGVLTTLYSFCSTQNLIGCLDGEEPGGLIQGTDGNFYGITISGGQFVTPLLVGGTVFKVTPSGTFTTLYSFCSRKDPNTGNCLDGNAPAGVIESSDGNFYGTTFSGGAHDDGTVFKLTPSGTLTTLYSFCSKGDSSINECLDGTDPAGVIEGSDGNFYGTTHAGGEFASVSAAGTAFMITPSGTLTTLYSFCSQLDPINFSRCLDGAEPDVGLIKASDGNFYGITSIGGATGDFGWGTAFKLSLSSPTSVSGSLTISPGQHSFGTPVVGNTHQGIFTVHAHSPNAASIILESFMIAGQGDYLVDPTMTTCQQGQTLENGQQCEIVVDFTPSRAAQETGTLVVTSNATEVSPKHGMVRLKGSGRPRGRK